jgi:pyridoxal phosphate enzyme (YggS family)
MIADNLRHVSTRIADACAAARRPVQSVTLLAVSKTFEAGAVREAFAAGQRRFGENKVQEGVSKIAALADLRHALEWHLIGPLQSNKTRAAAEQFDWVHSIDRVRIAERLSEQRPMHLPPLQVCLQVNVSGEATKSGFAPSEVAAAAAAVRGLPRLALRGLMTIPEPSADVAAQRAPFRVLKELLDALNGNGNGFGLDTLSMGMSDDLEAAIAEGATIVRVGSAIFGSRPRLAAVDPVQD